MGSWLSTPPRPEDLHTLAEPFVTTARSHKTEYEEMDDRRPVMRLPPDVPVADCHHCGARIPLWLYGGYQQPTNDTYVQVARKGKWYHYCSPQCAQQAAAAAAAPGAAVRTKQKPT